MYWTSTALVLTALVAIGLLAAWAFGGRSKSSRLGGRRHEPIDQRRQLGIPTQAQFATTRQLASLRARRPQPDRLVLARQGRHHLMTEAASHQGRRGVRGAVASGSVSNRVERLLSFVQRKRVVLAARQDVVAAVRRRWRPRNDLRLPSRLRRAARDH